MSNYKPYASYKDSGLDWLGYVPDHWPVRKGKWEWKKESRPVHEDDEIVTAFRDGQVTLRKNRREDGFTMASLEHGYQGIRKGDLVIHGMDAFAGAIGVSDSNGKSSPVYSACTPLKESNPRFFAYLLKEMSKKGWIEALAKGIRERSTEFKFPEFSNLQYPIPPKSEQTAIAQFLDRKTTEIKAFIELKEKTIALLKERKTAIINQAVTKGLDPNVLMKDSGIEWLGEIPKHWEVKKLKFLFRIVKRIVGELGYDVLSITQGGIKIKDITSGEGQLSMDYSKYQLIEPGDFGMNHMDLLTGYVDISKYHGVISPDYRVFQLISKKADPSYFLNLFQMGYKNKIFFAYGQGSSQLGRWRLPADAFKNFIVPLPPKKEQLEIMEFIKTETKDYDIEIGKIESEILLIKEYQQSLISEAVTGKIDVRGEVVVQEQA